MLSVSDIAKLLEQIPIWKSLVGLPKRIAELEARIAALETMKATQAAPGATDCPLCGAKMTVTKESPDGPFAAFGHKRHHMRCDNCGHTTDRKFIPGEGYR